ncbi:hypothetical protein ED5_2844 [Enterobacter roggenkampii]|nr:hypothetical protein ED5_2844 [Enterobacter roggenkampii]
MVYFIIFATFLFYVILYVFVLFGVFSDLEKWFYQSLFNEF